MASVWVLADSCVFFFPASALLLGYMLEQLFGEGYLGRLQVRKEDHPDTTRRGDMGVLVLDLFVFGTDTCLVLR